MSIDITSANAYFGAAVHIQSESWTRIPLARRIAAISHAARLIANRLEDPLETDTTSPGDFPRHDAAVYEQALWLLTASDLNATVQAFILNSKQQGGSIAANVRALQSVSQATICQPALKHLVLNPRSVRMTRG